MRLICPNCGAQYEVAEDVIPENGRDVQCSNCGHTWLESPGASVVAEEEEPAFEEESQDPEGWNDDTSEDEATPPEPAPEFVAPASDEDRMTPAPTPPGAQENRAQRQALDPSIAEILKEEAAREEASRLAEKDTGLESQGDLGLQDTTGPDATREREARERIARLKGEEADTNAAIAATVVGSRKELLPDIEEINSTLRPSTSQPEVIPLEEELVEDQRRGFRFGFLMVLGIIILLALIYLFADQIGTAVPALANVMEGYVNTVDGLRIWLDMKIQGLLTSLEVTEPPEG